MQDHERAIERVIEMGNQKSTAKYMNAKEVEARWRGAITAGTLANWRSKKIGPPFVKFRSRVLYLISDLEAWEAEQQAQSSAA